MDIVYKKQFCHWMSWQLRLFGGGNPSSIALAKGAFSNHSRGPYGEQNYMKQIVVLTRRTGPGNDL